MTGSGNRITIPAGLLPAADRADDLDGPESEVRGLVPLYAVPWLLFTFDDLRALPLDSRAAFVASLIDGRSTVEMIVDMSGMGGEEALGILGRLLRFGAIELRDLR